MARFGLAQPAPGRSTPVVVLALTVSLAVWCVVMTSPLAGHLLPVLPPAARNLASGLFLVAGVAHLGRWRLTGDWASARTCIVLLVLGTSLSANSALGSMFGEDHLEALGAPGARLLFVLPLVLLAVTSARHNTRLARQSFAVLMATCLALAVAFAAVSAASPALPLHLPVLWRSTEILTAGAWATLAWQGWHRYRLSGTSSPARWAVLGLALMFVTEVLKLWSLTDARAVHGLSSGFQLAAAVCATGASIHAFLASLHRRGEVDSALTQTHERLTFLEDLHRQRLHDARSAVLGVKGASQLLSARATLAPVDAATLRGLVSAELDRLQHLLDLEWIEPETQFELTEALRPVLAAHRVGGLRVETALPRLTVTGRPRTTATVLDNLLRNVARHAPGAQVLVSARRVGDTVHVLVEDDGPGIATTERETVLLRGVRGRAAAPGGTGLGLAGAAAAMADQGGSLRIGARRGGGTQVRLALPGTAPDDQPLAS